MYISDVTKYVPAIIAYTYATKLLSRGGIQYSITFDMIFFTFYLETV